MLRLLLLCDFTYAADVYTVSLNTSNSKQPRRTNALADVGVHAAGNSRTWFLAGRRGQSMI